MRLAAKWRRDRTWHAGLQPDRSAAFRLGGEWVDVLRVGNGQPLVLIPGLAGGWKLVSPLARSLGRHFEVFVIGLRGDRDAWHADQDPSLLSADLGGYAADVKDMIGRLGLESPAVMGVSFGGAIALELATRYPFCLDSLILSGVEAKFHPSVGSVIARRVLERYPLPCDSPFVNQFFHLLYGCKPEPGPMVEFVVQSIWETSQKVMARRLAQLEAFDVSDRLWRVDVPTLVLAGGRDVIVPPARQRQLAESIAGARCEVLPDAGHVGFLTHRPDFVQAVRSHLGLVHATV